MLPGRASHIVNPLTGWPLVSGFRVSELLQHGSVVQPVLDEFRVCESHVGLVEHTKGSLFPVDDHVLPHSLTGVSNCSSTSGMSSVSSTSGRSVGSNQASSSVSMAGSSSIRSASVASCVSMASASSSTAPSVGEGGGACSRGRTHHKSNCSCSNNGCLGAIPRNPSSSSASHVSSSSSSSVHRQRPGHQRSLSPSGTVGYAGTLKSVTNINYNLMYTAGGSGSISSSTSSSNNNSNINHLASGSSGGGGNGDASYSSYTNGNTLMRSRLPTIKESPVHIVGNHKNRWVVNKTKHRVVVR